MGSRDRDGSARVGCCGPKSASSDQKVLPIIDICLLVSVGFSARRLLQRCPARRHSGAAGVPEGVAVASSVRRHRRVATFQSRSRGGKSFRRWWRLSHARSWRGRWTADLLPGICPRHSRILQERTGLAGGQFRVSGQAQWWPCSMPRFASWRRAGGFAPRASRTVVVPRPVECAGQLTLPCALARWPRRGCDRRRPGSCRADPVGAGGSGRGDPGLQQNKNAAAASRPRRHPTVTRRAGLPPRLQDPQNSAGRRHRAGG